LIQTGDNHGPPQPDEIKRLLEEADRKLPGVKIRIGRLSDFADAILAEKPQLPVVRGDMPDTWIHGPMCDPAGARLARNIRPQIAAAESLGAMLRSWGVAQPPHIESTIAGAYEQSLLYGEHTWGGSLGWVVQYSQHTPFDYGKTWQQQRANGRFQRLEASWAEHSAYIEKAQSLLAPLLASELQTLAANVKIDGQRIVVFNPLPWKRDGVVTVKIDDPQLTALKAEDGKVISAARQQDGAIRFVAPNVPPLGYRTFVPFRSNNQSQKNRLHRDSLSFGNEFLEAKLDPARGAIISLVDKRIKRELLDPASPHGFGQYLYERFDADQVAAYVKAYVKINADWAVTELGKPSLPPAKEQPYVAVSPQNCQLSWEQTPISISALMRCAPTPRMPHGVLTKVTLYAGQPYLDLEVTVCNKSADPWPEAGWICLPVKAADPRFRLQRQASIVDPSKDIIPGANRCLFGVNGGLTIVDSSGRGVGICPLDSPLVSLDTPGCWNYSLDFIPRKPAAYLNLFNNQWSTNFRLWNEGTWTSRVRIWAVDNLPVESGLVSPSLEARYPLESAVVDAPAGGLLPTQAGLSLSRKGVMVTAFGPNPDGAGTLLRLWEYTGRASLCRVQLPAGLRAQRVQPVDLRGRPLGSPEPVRNQSFNIPMRAFAPASAIIETDVGKGNQ
jgi:hypothetical protein